jgi:hypothetical protein
VCHATARAACGSLVWPWTICLPGDLRQFLWTLPLSPSSHLVRTLLLLFFDLSVGGRSLSVHLSEESAHILVDTPASRLPLHLIPWNVPANCSTASSRACQLLLLTL